jgi:hypothetical protein
MKSILALVWLSTGCVVRQYGGGTTTAAVAESLAPVDFSDVEAQLDRLIAAETEDVDRRDRMEAAWELCQKMKTQRPAAQHETFRFLMRLVEIEKRVQAASMDAIADPDQQTFVPIASISAERIGEAQVAVVPSAAQRVAIVPPDAGAAVVMDAARERMGRDDLEGALKQLDVCEGQPCGAATVTLWREVRDRLVYQRRETAGAAFLVARDLTDTAARAAGLERVARDLKTLQRDYPNSRYAEGVAASLVAVDAALKNGSQ